MNAATGFGSSNLEGAVRLCFGLGPSAFDTVPPLPDRGPFPPSSGGFPLTYPGIGIGTGAKLPDTSADLAAIAVSPYLLNAKSLSQRGLVSGASCADILAADAGGPLVPGIDSWKLPDLPAGTFATGKSILLVLVGCARNGPGAAQCGNGFMFGPPGNGNLTLSVYELDRTTPIAVDRIGAQFVHAMTLADERAAAGGFSFIPGFTADITDAGAFVPLTGQPVMFKMGTPLAQVLGVNVASDAFAVTPSQPLAYPLPLIESISYGKTRPDGGSFVPDGGVFRNGAAFTFIGSGDLVRRFIRANPNQPYDFGGFHIIAVPNDPATELYSP